MDYPLPLMHGLDWQGENVAGWWASEKFNGWRAYWTGERLLTRQGRDYHAPDWFTAVLPAFPLDCELWLGRGLNHDDVHRAIAAGEWSRLNLVAFDCPGMVFEDALATLCRLGIPDRHFTVADFWQVRSTEDARASMRKIVKAGGEGIMLRSPGSKYKTASRSYDLLKLKPRCCQ